MKEIIKNLLLVIIVLAVLVSGVSIGLNIYTNHGESVEIPNVKSMRPEIAKSLFEAQELSYQIIDSTYNKAVSPGTIIETIPPTGSKVKKGRTIYIRLNSYSAGMISIPDVGDLSQRQATAMLKALGISKIDVKWVSGNYRDLVVGLEYRGQPLQIKDKVPANATVTLLVASGSEPQDSIEVATPNEVIEDSGNPFDF
jgi:beta-lactam-binding protein with PASTA domain